MQSTGQTSTHAVSFVSIQGSVITKGIVFPPECPPSDESVTTATDSTCEGRRQQSHTTFAGANRYVFPCAGIGQKLCSIVPYRNKKPVRDCVHVSYIQIFTQLSGRRV